ncbi:hypothetical protein B0J17DRAFT_305521 [Rhizoctonia solani]|nr:hypothetical protein B0J17DRAFT_305521 [Rhizoctonia solani]
MEQQIAQARSALSKTRNDLASPVHRLPEEILDEIFAYVIYSPQYSYTEFGVHLAEMEEHLLKIYRSLYALLGVCSPWKKAILNQGYFWSTVPLIQQQSVESDWGSKTTKACPKYREAGNVSFKRAKDHRLDLAVVFRTGFCSDMNYGTLQEYLPRIRTINAVSNSIMGIWRIMDTIVPAASALSSLSELSICQKQDQHFYYSIPSEHDHMYLGYSTGVVALNEFLESLPVLRISGAHMCWDMLVFSNRLAKLRLQDINFGTDHTMMANLCHALASATGLRELEIVSIISFHESQEPFASSLGMISLPNLESLLMDNLFLNTLECILNCIITRSHRLTLHLTPNFLYFNLTGEQVLEQATQASPTGSRRTQSNNRIGANT